MRLRTRSVAALVGCFALLAAGAASATDTTHPAPTPGGPAAPVVPAIDGPVNIDNLAVAVRPDGGYLTGVHVEFDRTSRTATSEKPAAATQFVFLFDKSIRFNPERFPTCDRADFTAHGPAGCPAGSQVGEGTAEIFPHTTAEVAVFNTRYASGARGVMITIPATGAVLDNTFEPVADPYRSDYGIGSDELLPSTLPPLERASTTRFRVSFGATHTDHTGTHSYVESFAVPGHDLKFGLWSQFVTGQVLLPTAHTTRPLP